MKTGIVILNYNDYDTTLNMIKRIKDYKELDLILIVDNKSIDNSYDKLKGLENNKIKVIQTDKNLGYAAGNNFGLKYLSDKNIDYVIISNPDVYVEEDVIKKMKKDLEKEYISLVAPNVFENNSISRGWKLPHFMEDLVSNISYFHKYSQKMLGYSDEYYNQELALVEVVHGCFFMIKYKDFLEINFFDEGTFLYYEENILGSKLLMANKKSFIDTTISVKHELSKSVDRSISSLNKYKILKQSQIYYEKKYNHLNRLGIIILKIFYYFSLTISYIYLLVINIGRSSS